MSSRNILAVFLLSILAAASALAQSTWNGSVSSAWSNASNWTPSGVPAAATSVTIASGAPNMPTLDVTAYAGTLTINSGATLSGSNRTLYVSGNWVNNGTFVQGTGTVEFNGAANATISGTSATTFNQVIIRKSSMAVTVTCQQSITANGAWPNSLVLEAGTFDVAAATVTAKGLWSNYSSGGVKQFRMNNAAGKFICEMCSFGANNTSATISAGTIECSSELMVAGDAPTSPYSALNFTGGTIIMVGPSARIALYDGFTHNSKSFFNLQIGKNAGDKTILTGSVGGGGTGLLADLIVKNQLKIVAGATLALKSGSYAQYSAILTGSFINDGIFDAQAGLVTIQNACTLSGAATTNFSGLTISSGASFTPQVDFGFSGSFTNNGTFTPNGKTVNVIGSGTSVISGSSNIGFATLNCSAAGKQINFASGKTFTISTGLNLTGAAGNQVKLRSTTTGTSFTLTDNGSETVSYVDVQDCTASNSITDYPGGTDSGNNQNWVFGPVLSVSALSGSNGSVFNDENGGGLGYKALSFTLGNSAAGIGATLNNLTFTGAGSGNHSTAYSSNGVALYRESGAASGFDAGDVQIGATNFNASPSASFTFAGAEASFASGASKQYYLVIKLNGTASNGQTFDFSVSGISVASPTTTSGVPSSSVRGFTIISPTLTIADNSSATQGSALTATGGHVIQKFTLTNTLGPVNTVSSIQVKAFGTGNDATDFTAVKLYRDANANSVFDSASDVLVDSKTAFPADNGTLAFALAGTEAQFASSATRQYFVVVDFANTMTATLDYASQVTGISGYNTGTLVNGAPAPAAGPTAGIALTPNTLTATLNGPASAQTVDSYAQGQGGIGLVIADVSLGAQYSGWSVTSLTFRASGSGNDQTAYNYLALFADSNSSGTFDGADSLAVSGAASAFAANDGDYVATLLTGAMVAATPRRFFLVGKLAGTASAAQTFGAQLQAVTAAQPQPGQVTGAPSTSTTALVIDAAALSVGNAPAAPQSALREGGTAFTHVIGAFRFSATNMVVPITGITLTTSGNGNWVSDVAAVELWLDNGNGAFDAATDTQVATAAGASPTVALVPTGLQVPNGGTADVWVRLSLNASAAASIPKTFSLSVAATTDVTATGAVVVMGAPAPASSTLSVVRFEVSQFTPAVALQAGGQPIVIRGSGFMAPVSLTIGGAPCPGTGVVNAAGTEITGFVTPAGSGQNLVMVLNNGVLGAKTLPMAFNYAKAKTIGGGGGGGCTSSEGGVAILLLLALLALGTRLRKKHVC